MSKHEYNGEFIGMVKPDTNSVSVHVDSEIRPSSATGK